MPSVQSCNCPRAHRRVRSHDHARQTKGRRRGRDRWWPHPELGEDVVDVRLGELQLHTVAVLVDLLDREVAVLVQVDRIEERLVRVLARRHRRAQHALHELELRAGLVLHLQQR